MIARLPLPYSSHTDRGSSNGSQWATNSITSVWVDHVATEAELRIPFEAVWDWLLVERVAGLVMGTLTDVEAEVVTDH